MTESKKILSNSSIIFVGTIVGSFASYLFNMLVGRWLGPDQYGEFSALLSLMMIISVFGGAVSTVIIKYTSEIYASKKNGALQKLFKIFSKYVLFFGLLLFFLSLIFIKPISVFLGIKNFIAIAIALFSFVFGFLIVVNRGILQGTQKFYSYSISGVIESILKLFIGVLLIKIGLALSGAMAGVIIATIIAYALTFIPLKKIFADKNNSKEDFSLNKREVIRYAGPTFIATVLLVVSLNIDILLVKHYFDAKDAGIYAAISTIAKIILYATTPIVAVMFPMISERRVSGDKHFKLFLYSLLFTLIGALTILAFYYIMPGTIIKLLYGQKFIDNYYLLPQLGFVILLYALINIVINYFISIKNFVFLPIFLFSVVAQISLISFYHSSLETIIKILIFVFGFLFVSLMAYYLFTKKEQLSLYLRGEYEQ